jgi:hypothetical protein
LRLAFNRQERMSSRLFAGDRSCASASAHAPPLWTLIDVRRFAILVDMGIMARITWPKNAQFTTTDAELEHEREPANWIAEDLSTVAHKMRRLVANAEQWKWTIDEDPDGISIRVELADGTKIESWPIAGIPKRALPKSEPPRWLDANL